MENLSSIYCQTYNFVYLRAKSILKKEEDIQQVVKEVYLKLAQETVDENQMYEWLAKQTYILGCQRFRTKKAREAQVIEWQSDALYIQKSVNHEKSKELIGDALDELPDMYQATLYAFYYDHMNLKETAAVMGYNVAVIKNRLNYVHKYLERTFENYQEDHKEKVLFSVEIVCAALKEWSLQNKMNVVAAQNVQVAIGKELNIEMQTVCQEGESAGAENRAKICSDEIQTIAEELNKHSAKKKASKKVSEKPKQEVREKSKRKVSPLVFIVGALVVVLIAGVLIFANTDKKEKTEKPDDNKTEISDSNVSQETDLDIEEEKEDVDTEVEQEEQNEEQDSTLDSSYILPNSNSVKLTRADLSGLTKEELRLARNEIFARNGMIFGVADLDNYFGAKSWYEPKYTSSEFERNVEMNAIEEANVSLILQVESEME